MNEQNEGKEKMNEINKWTICKGLTQLEHCFSGKFNITRMNSRMSDTYGGLTRIELCFSGFSDIRRIHAVVLCHGTCGEKPSIYFSLSLLVSFPFISLFVSFPFISLFLSFSHFPLFLSFSLRQGT